MHYIKFQNFKINIEILSDEPLAMDSETSPDLTLFNYCNRWFFRSC